eukprot:scaffold1279_cov31-Phaeocystis_antarctica.AAC.3
MGTARRGADHFFCVRQVMIPHRRASSLGSPQCSAPAPSTRARFSSPCSSESAWRAASAATASSTASFSVALRGAIKIAAASASARRAASARSSAAVTSSRAASSSADRRSLVARAAAASIIVPRNVPARLSFCAAAAAAAALLTALSAMHLACFSSISTPRDWTHSSSVVLDCDICRCSERWHPQSMCAMLYFPALAFATSVDVMIGMLAVSASRASFNSSSPFAEAMQTARVVGWTILRALRAARMAHGVSTPVCSDTNVL